MGDRRRVRHRAGTTKSSSHTLIRRLEQRRGKHWSRRDPIGQGASLNPNVLVLAHLAKEVTDSNIPAPGKPSLRANGSRGRKTRR
jgi:hypothetical protein